MYGLQLKLFPDPIYLNTSFEEDSIVWQEATKTKFYCDGFISAINGRKFLDLIAIDKSLMNMYPNYGNRAADAKLDRSMREFIYSRFGKEIYYLIEKWTRVMQRPSEEESEEESSNG